ncbi:MAG TPA: PIN domain-containing protein [Chloroflexia bacterium]
MTVPTAKYLVDTNILVYAYDRNGGLKHRRAIEILESLVETEIGALSTQVLSEFYVVATRKLKTPLDVSAAVESVEYFLTNWTVLNVTPAIVGEALRGVQRSQLPYWDALIWATAKTNQIPVVLTEDFNTGTSLDGVQMVNPLAQGVDLKGLSN